MSDNIETLLRKQVNYLSEERTRLAREVNELRRWAAGIYRMLPTLTRKMQLVLDLHGWEYSEEGHFKPKPIVPLGKV